MARFLIEVPHEAKTKECAQAVKILLDSGSHYLTNAEFGCLDGEHKAWIIVEVDTREEALLVVPSIFRHRAKIVQLNRFSLDQIEQILEQHRE
jgi:hypothetical protein